MLCMVASQALKRAISGHAFCDSKCLCRLPLPPFKNWLVIFRSPRYTLTWNSRLNTIYKSEGSLQHDVTFSCKLEYDTPIPSKAV